MAVFQLFTTRWQKLREALIEKRSKLGETQSLQRFCRDADEADAWIVDKMQYATDTSYKDTTNIQVRLITRRHVTTDDVTTE